MRSAVQWALPKSYPKPFSEQLNLFCIDTSADLGHFDILLFSWYQYG
jgi:hypothetical protein